MIKYIIVLTLFLNLTFANTMQEGEFVKEKQEIAALKAELTDFYKQKEEEYLARKKELEDLLATITTQKKEIKDLYEKNKKILDDIEGRVQAKTTNIYNAMKPKVAAGIFSQMIDDGKINDVFDIILKLKEKKVTQLMKFLGAENSAIITKMLHDYKVEN